MPANTNIQSRIESLRAQLREHDYRYYVLAEPSVLDREYDALFKELGDLEKEYPQFDSFDSPTKRIGDQPTKGFPTVRAPHAHAKPREYLQRTGIARF